MADFETWTVRHAINRVARNLGCEDSVSELTEIDAIRFLQQREGYSTCFGRAEPLQPISGQPDSCEIYKCLWRGTCDKYRHREVIPLDKELVNCKLSDVERLKNRLIELNEMKTTLLSNDAIGMQFRSYTHSADAIRKLLVATPKTVLGENSTETHQLKTYILEHKPIGGYYSGTINATYHLVMLHTSDITALQKIFSEARIFFDKGNLAYYPLIETMNYELSGLSKSTLPGDPSTPLTPQVHLPHEIKVSNFDAPHLGLPDGEIMLTDPDIAPLLNIELPVLENIDYRTLNKLMTDYPEELCSFRDFLRSKVEEMRAASVGSQEFVHDCRKIEREIREQIRKLNSDYKKAKLTSAFALTGCAIASWTLAFYCITQGTNNLLTVLGPGGALYTASAAYSDYLVKQLNLKDNPAYFLWVLGKTKSSK